jgi:hypothetical protein
MHDSHSACNGNRSHIFTYIRTVRSCGICGGQSDTGAGFIRVLRFPLPILIPQTTPYSSSSGAGTVGQLVADVPSGLSLTLPPKNYILTDIKRATHLNTFPKTIASSC